MTILSMLTKWLKLVLDKREFKMIINYQDMLVIKELEKEEY